MTTFKRKYTFRVELSDGTTHWVNTTSKVKARMLALNNTPFSVTVISCTKL